MRRRFLVLGHTQTTDPDLSLNDLAGASGRIDVLVRAITSALCVSHGVRDDTEVWTVIDHDDVHDGPRTLVWHGDRLRNLNPDERSTAALFKRAFAADVVDHLEEVHPGLEAAAYGFRDALKAIAEGGPLIFLDKDGEDLRAAGRSMDPDVAPCFVLSDHQDWTDAERAILDDLVQARWSVGATWLQGHQVVTLVHDELDRRAA